MAGANITILLGTLRLADPSDAVFGVEFDGDAEVEVVKYFRDDRAKTRGRGGQVDTVAFTVEREHPNLQAAVLWLVSRRKAVRALGLTPGLVATLTFDYGTPFVTKLLDATVKPGRSNMRGLRTSESFTLTGAFADTL